MPGRMKKAGHDEIPGHGFRALLRVQGLIDRVMQPYFGRFGISRSQWACLRVLYRAEQEGLPGMRRADLGRRLLIRPPSVTGLIERLRRLGYVGSNSSAADLRGKEVRLSQTGRALVERILQGHGNQISAVMGGLDAAGQQQLYLLLQHLAHHLESMAEGENHEAR
jgi:MarR family transcriptional regulator, 2-MHQ and catechol-resistance regulon repressor